MVDCVPYHPRAYDVQPAPATNRTRCRTAAKINQVVAVFIVVVSLTIVGATPTDAQTTDRIAHPDSVLSVLNASDSLDTHARFLRGRRYEQLEKYGLAAIDYEAVLQVEPGHLEAELGFRRVRSPAKPLSDEQLALLGQNVESNPDRATLRFRYGDALYRREQYEAALEQFERYLTMTQATPEALKTILITISASGKHHALGERLALEYAEIYPGNDDLFMRLGYFRLWQRKFDSAKSAFQTADSLNSSDPLAKQGLAEVDSLARVLSRESTRISSLLKRVNDDPANVNLRLQLIDVLMREGHYFDVDQHLAIIGRQETVSADERTRVEALSGLLHSGGRAAPAERIDRQILTLYRNPDDLETRYSLAEDLLSKNRFYEAVDILRVVREQEGGAERWLKLFVAADSGLVKAHGQSPLYGVDRLSDLLRAQPDNLMIRYALVDSLLLQHRYTEAGEILIATPDVAPDDRGHEGRLIAVAQGREVFAQEEIQRAESIRTEGSPLPDDLARALPDHLLITGDLERATKEYERLILHAAGDGGLMADWIRFLRTTGSPDRAAEEAEKLINRFSEHPALQKEYVLAHLSSGLGDRGRTMLDRLLSDSTQSDGSFLLDVGDLLVADGNIDAADSLLNRVRILDSSALGAGVDMLSERIRRERLLAVREQGKAMLQDAQRLAQMDSLQKSVDLYRAYFDSVGVRLRDEWRQLAWVFIADSLYDDALPILEALNESIQEANADDFADAYDLKKDLAQVRAAIDDPSGALELIDELTEFNPRDFETRFLAAQIQRESGDYEEALSAYEDALTLARGSSWLDDQWRSLDADLRYSLFESGEWNGYDYSGIIVPVTETVHAGGGDTFYDRVSEGLRAEMTLPIGAVLTAGFVSHFISGSRRQVPHSEEARGRANQIFGGIYLDLTPPVRSEKAPYTNRLFIEAGLIDYEGQRSVGYFDARYWRQVPGAFLSEIGVRSSEGAIDLWSPAGGEFNLRLTQLDARAEGVPFLPDSLLRVAGRLAIDAVSDNLGILSSGSEQNIGSEIQLEAGYKVLSHTYLGLAYHALDFRSRTDLYFSPEHYESTEVFLEYEKEIPTSWYVRVRGALGAISRSAGALSKRLELDLIRRLTDKLSLTLTSTLNETSRSLGGGDSNLYSRYTMFSLSGRVYWTL